MMQFLPEILWIVVLLVVLTIHYRMGLKLIKTVQERYPHELDNITDVYDPILRFRMHSHTKMVNTLQHIRYTDYDDKNISLLQKKWFISRVLIYTVGVLFLFYLLHPWS